MNHSIEDLIQGARRNIQKRVRKAIEKLTQPRVSKHIPRELRERIYSERSSHVGEVVEQLSSDLGVEASQQTIDDIDLFGSDNPDNVFETEFLYAESEEGYYVAATTIENTDSGPVILGMDLLVHRKGITRTILLNLQGDEVYNSAFLLQKEEESFKGERDVKSLSKILLDARRLDYKEATPEEVREALPVFLTAVRQYEGRP